MIFFLKLILILSYLNFEFPEVKGIPIPNSIAVLGNIN